MFMLPHAGSLTLYRKSRIIIYEITCLGREQCALANTENKGKACYAAQKQYRGSISINHSHRENAFCRRVQLVKCLHFKKEKIPEIVILENFISRFLP